MGLLRVQVRDLSLPLAVEEARSWCRALEAGEILHLGPSPIAFSSDELELLRSCGASLSGHHKNIAYRPVQDRLTGCEGADRERLHQLLRRFSHQAIDFMRAFLSPYRFDLDYASFRPLEEEGRRARLSARNDLLHVDSFPTRPSHGRRILRFFINVNASQPRVWKTGPPFPDLARSLAAASGLLPAYRKQRDNRLGKLLPWRRPPYDRFMLDFHHWLKANQEFQSRPHLVTEFEPMASWMCMTDTLSHAVLRGRFALEQTLLVLPETLVAPEVAPREVLQSLAA